jgi:VWFA-related protein
MCLASDAAAAQEVVSAPTFGVQASRVAVDLVVRDKRGRLIRDLKASEIELYEDGVRQEIDSLRLTERGGVREIDIRSTQGLSTEAEGLGLVAETSRIEAVPELAVNVDGNWARADYLALVFDRLGLEARNVVGRALRERYSGEAEMREQVGVFLVDRGLGLVQPFTRDPLSVVRGVERVVGLQPDVYTAVREGGRIRDLRQRLSMMGINPDGPKDAGASPLPVQGFGAAGPGGGDAAMLQLQLGMLTFFRELEQQLEAGTAIRALLSVIASLEQLPGRKAIVFFSEGFTLPEASEPAFRALVAAATRAAISVYSVDAAGLRLISPNQALLLEDSYNPALASLRSVERGLERLASETGGFAVRDTNDFGKGLARIEEELGAYYQLAYSPKNQIFDGRFRTIAVRVSRPHGPVQSRRGYYAVRTATPTPLLENEAPAVARLESNTWPTEIPLRMVVLQFPEEPGATRVPVVVEVALDALGREFEEGSRKFRQDFTILALIRGSSGKVVRKLAQRYSLSGSFERSLEARTGAVLFYKEAELPPGRYSLEAAVYDTKSGKAGTARALLELPPFQRGHLRTSNPFILRRAEKLTAEERKSPMPLHYGDLVLYPNMGEPIAGAGRHLAFHIAVWPARPAQTCTVYAEVRDPGGAIRRRTEAPTTARSGRMDVASTVSVDGLDPGTYELRVRVQNGGEEVVKSVPFDLVPRPGVQPP